MAFDKPIAVLTIAAEASSQDHQTRLGVAATIFNRVHAGFAPTIAGVCLKRHWYSEWNADAIDNANLERVANMAQDDPVILDCGVAYDEAASGQDPTQGATHYYDTSIAPPYWAVAPASETCQLGKLVFWKGVK